jgi:hypothetical protein
MGWASDALAGLERLFLLGLTEISTLAQGKENDRLAGDGADVLNTLTPVSPGPTLP